MFQTTNQLYNGIYIYSMKPRIQQVSSTKSRGVPPFEHLTARSGIPASLLVMDSIIP